MDTEDRHRDEGKGEGGSPGNVVRLPRDWLGPRDQLVPFGPGASGSDTPRDPEDDGPRPDLVAASPVADLTGEVIDFIPPPVLRPDAFWSEESASIHDALEAPAVFQPTAKSPPREEVRRAARQRSQRRRVRATARFAARRQALAAARRAAASAGSGAAIRFAGATSASIRAGRAAVHRRERAFHASLASGRTGVARLWTSLLLKPGQALSHVRLAPAAVVILVAATSGLLAVHELGPTRRAGSSPRAATADIGGAAQALGGFVTVLPPRHRATVSLVRRVGSHRTAHRAPSHGTRAQTRPPARGSGPTYTPSPTVTVEQASYTVQSTGAAANSASSGSAQTSHTAPPPGPVGPGAPFGPGHFG